MPKTKDRKSMNTSTGPPENKHATHESTAFLNGLFTELVEQVSKYHYQTSELLALEARIEISEKMLCLTRDHFVMTIDNTQDALPNDWDEVLRKVRFVGVRLADACMNSLQEHKRLTPEQLLADLNNGMFRFRTNSPLREIHAALLRHPYVKREKGSYVWVAPPEAQQIKMRLRVTEREWSAPEPKNTKEDKEAAPMAAVAS